MTAPGAPRIVPFLLGTAGHVDHGKTSLVRHLTGEDTDRAPEEKRRGMSIDFGVASMPLPGDRVIGIIDVPGHEDFIANMVAGASSIDLLLLIVAADDAVMPQTIEHLTIASLLGMSRLMVVVTKVDLVDTEMLSLVREEVREFLAAAGYSDAPIFEISNVTGAGMDALRMAIGDAVESLTRVPDERAFRMDIRALFSLKGHGNVVTGIPVSGVATVGESLTLLPGNTPVVLRSIQSYHQSRAETAPHVSTALNVRDLDRDAVHRGMTLAAEDAYAEGLVFLVRMKSVLRKKKLKRRSYLRLHAGTAKSTVSCRIVDEGDLPPSGTCFATLVLETPLVLTSGDRFILRNPSPSETVAGGVVLGRISKPQRRRSAGITERLEQAAAAIEAGDRMLAALWAADGPILQQADLVLASQRGPGGARAEIARLESAGLLVPLGAEWRLFLPRKAEIVSRVEAALARYHRANKLTWGMPPGNVCELVGVPAACLDALTKVLKTDSRITTAHGKFALNTFAPEISAKLLKARDEALKQIREAGIATLARGPLRDALGVSEAEFKTVLKILTEEREVILLGNNLMACAEYERCRSSLLDLFRGAEVVELAAFREATGTSRNIAAIILEGFDSLGLTKRVSNGRILTDRDRLRPATSR